MRLFAIPYAFGNSNIYYELSKTINPEIEVVPVEYSGHAQRYKEPLYYTMEEIVDDIYRQILPLLCDEYVLFGYSMGGTVCYELFQLLVKNGHPLPKCVMAFGSTEPDFKHKKDEFELYNLEQVRNLLIEMDGTEPEILNNDEVLELVKPVIISDSVALRDYIPTPAQKGALTVPLYVVRGEEEEGLENCEKSWRSFCNSSFSYQLTHGEHFFMFDGDGARTAEFAKMIEKMIFESVEREEEEMESIFNYKKVCELEQEIEKDIDEIYSLCKNTPALVRNVDMIKTHLCLLKMNLNLD